MCGDYSANCAIADIRKRFCVPDDEATRTNSCVSIGPRLKPSDTTLDHKSTGSPVDQSIVFFQNRSVGGIAVVLRSRGKFAKSSQRFRQQLSAQLCQSIH